MKIMINKLLVVFFLFNILDVVAGPGPPGAPVPPRAPINDNLVVLLVIGFLFGIRILYKYKLKTKASV